MRRSLGIAAAVLVLALAIFHTPVFGTLGSYLVKADAPAKADVALVLAGDYSGGRVLKAGELIRAGFAPYAFVSGPSGMYGTHECDLEIGYAVHAGYPENYFRHLEHDARSTAEEAGAVIGAIRRVGAHRVLLVTSDFHTRRAGGVFRRAAPDLEFIVVAAPTVEFSADGWWHSREGRKVALYEWMKTVADWFGI